MAAVRSWWIRFVALGFLGLFLWGVVLHGGHRHEGSHASAGIQSLCTLCQAHNHHHPAWISQKPTPQNLPGHREIFKNFIPTAISPILAFQGSIRAPPHSA